MTDTAASLLGRTLFEAQGESPFSDARLLAAMLRFEAALAEGQAALGLIPAEASARIGETVHALTLDAAAMARAGAHAGSLAIPVVRALTDAVAERDPDAARYVHAGATSQDVIDTALSLCAKEALGRIDAATRDAIAAGLDLVDRFAGTPVLARTLMQPAGLTTFGCRAAQWTTGIADAWVALRRSARDAVALSLSGPIGTLAAWGEAGDALRAAVAERLDLPDPGAPGHGVRNGRLRCAGEAAILVGAFARVGEDVALGAQFEVGEVSEPAADGRGGSSAMPHKRNPALSLRLIAAGQRVPGLMATLLGAQVNAFERGLGGWQTECATWPALLETALGAAETAATLLSGLEIHTDRAQANIAALQGIFAADRVAGWLASALGKVRAQGLAARWSAEALSRREPLESVVRRALGTQTPAIAADGLDACFDVGPAVEAAARTARALASRVRGT